MAWLVGSGAGRAEAQACYLSGRAPAPTAAECAAQVRRHMPERISLYASACELSTTMGCQPSRAFAKRDCFKQDKRLV